MPPAIDTAIRPASQQTRVPRHTCETQSSVSPLPSSCSLLNLCLRFRVCSKSESQNSKCFAVAESGGGWDRVTRSIPEHHSVRSQHTDAVRVKPSSHCCASVYRLVSALIHLIGLICQDTTKQSVWWDGGGRNSREETQPEHQSAPCTQNRSWETIHASCHGRQCSVPSREGRRTEEAARVQIGG